MAAAKSNPQDESSSQDEAPFEEARLALTNGRIEQALPLLERVLESPDSQRRTWARQMLEEVDVAVSDHTARQSLEQLSDENLELFVRGEACIDVQGFHFSYPALSERFQQTLTKNAPAALERLKAAARRGENLFDELLEAVKVASLGQISEALFEVGGRYRRAM